MINLNDETIALLQRMGSVVNAEDGKTYYFLPFWFECDNESENSFIIHHLNRLPKPLVDKIIKDREI